MSCFIYIVNDKACAITRKGQIKIQIYDGVVQTLCDIIRVLELKKNLIYLGTLHANCFGCETDCIRVGKGAFIVMKGKMSARNIYKLMSNTIIDRAAIAKSDHDITVLWHKFLQVLCVKQMLKSEVEDGKHKIDVLLNYVVSGQILLEKIHILDNVASMFTKIVTTEKFKHCLNLINISKC